MTHPENCPKCNGTKQHKKHALDEGWRHLRSLDEHTPHGVRRHWEDHDGHIRLTVGENPIVVFLCDCAQIVRDWHPLRCE